MRISLVLITAMAVVGVVRQTSADLFYEYPDPVDSIEFIYPGNSGPYSAWPLAEENLTQGPGIGFDEFEPHDKLVGGAGGDWVTEADAGYPADYVEGVGMPVIRLDLGEDMAPSKPAFSSISNMLWRSAPVIPAIMALRLSA